MRAQSVIRSFGRYFHHHHRWILSIIAVVVAAPLFTLYLQNLNWSTSTYYYVPKHTSNTSPKLSTASCWASSASQREDAYRCIVKNSIYDPCFSYGDEFKPGFVACPNSNATSERDFRLTLASWYTQQPIYTRIQNNSTRPNVPWYIL